MTQELAYNEGWNDAMQQDRALGILDKTWCILCFMSFGFARGLMSEGPGARVRRTGSKKQY